MGDLSSITLPENHRFLRAVPRGLEEDRDFVAAYDQRTFFYDVFYDGQTGQIYMVGPALRNLRRYFKNAVLEVDGIVVPERETRRLSPRTSEAIFQSPVDDPKTLTLSQRRHPPFSAAIPINRTDHDKFRGKNALVAISKNNALEWIEDWLRYYADRHGANAVVLIDNGSDAYSIDDLRSRVEKVAGIEAAQVISAPFPFGPKATSRVEINAKFFHLSMLHIAQRRYLAAASAVLSVDIDELIVGPEGQSVFAAVKSSPLGFLSVPGSWRYARKPGDARKVVHTDHIYQRIGGDAFLQPKWCVDPSGPLAGNYWRVHGIVDAKRYFSHDFIYLHCRHISTNWDYDRDFEPDDLFEPAPDTAQIRAVLNRA